MVLGLIEKPDLENCKEFEEIETRKYEVSVEHLNSFQCKHVLLKQCNLCILTCSTFQYGFSSIEFASIWR